MKTGASASLLPVRTTNSNGRAPRFGTPEQAAFSASTSSTILRVRQKVLFLLVLVLVADLLDGGGTRALAADNSSLEYKVKAAFLYNFAKFVSWPTEQLPEPDSPIIVGVVGEDPFGDILDDTVKGKRIDGRKILVRRFASGEDLRKCHVLFISRSLRDSLDSILAGLKPGHVLAVSETEKFAQRGGIINFIVVNDTVKFEINLEAAENAGLKISSKLSRVARVIKSDCPPTEPCNQ